MEVLESIHKILYMLVFLIQKGTQLVQLRTYMSFHGFLTLLAKS